ncbi:zinc finger homeobox protein 4-like isoform X1 [Limulus polyphemus]|uniref:Zinc finger homeobox protein 4-like isoform X1 n=1 Tax=Limulus polyphemus TaxID=6850 RepID=A0ABM1S1H9_LIMPO|nr:zinc finger homeobox protein 4-like isoform X1 [Limulus polyphemus]XP_022237471.1 zinc finger homeobox protein 4-like isoform X1 [Limulus polyphemus]XP_022237479.1 zinc finger homeobox protein 4-like isoform X1 [Limulus polyphemus]XP_022237484.1 zinc finger homeobox protein 4-like isoform X1 [Limulus polyphemus]
MELDATVEGMDTGQQSAGKHELRASPMSSKFDPSTAKVVRPACFIENKTIANKTRKETYVSSLPSPPLSSRKIDMTPQDDTPDPLDQKKIEGLSFTAGKTDVSKRSNQADEQLDLTQRCDQQTTSTTTREILTGQGERKSSVDSELSDSDVETFTGKILYNPDGSAYIIEGESELSDEECSLDLPQQEGSIVDGQGMTSTQYRIFPEIVNAFHIYRNSTLYSALYGQAFNLLQEKKKVPEIPIVHSYKVFNVRQKKSSVHNKDDRKTNVTAPNKRSSSGDKPRCSYEYSSVPIKPILMCFMCKLSFGYAKSFVAHAVGEHGINLLEEENNLLSQKNISAIIQGVGKEKEPLLSFLEPATDTPVQVNECVFAQSVQSTCSSFTHSLVNNSCLNVASTVMASSVPSAAGTTAVTSTTSAVTTLVSANLNPVASVRDIKTSLIENQKHNEVRENVTDCTSSEAIAPELEDLATIEKLAKAAAAAAEATSTESTGDCKQADFTNSMPKNSESLNREGPMKFPVSSALGSGILSIERPKSCESGGSIYSESSVSPKASTSPGLFFSSSLSPAPSTSTGFNICPHHLDRRNPECSKCDTVLGSSPALGGHMAMMHSRNSCKTLKCPKCNWHYKYQETLEIHMKEKHPENETSCVYCITNQKHPKLARGETYNCGYKPYRCEICNYSTVTKGNLSIHMHSDKHINNVQELQNGNLPTEHILAPQNVSNTHVSEPAKSGILSTKPKATWRCDVCNYETNVARNLRIHMTSEKHTHNMMVVQQNVKHMQQLSAFQQAQVMDPMFSQFHSGFLFPPDSQLQPEAALADLYYNQALLVMASQQQQQQRLMAAASTSGKNPFHPSPFHFPCSSTVDMENADPILGQDIPQDDSALFFCCVCSCFSTDSIEHLNQHFQLDRTQEREDEIAVVAGNYICKLCTYKTNLKANFQLHCKTDKHFQRLQHVNHIKEGGPRNEWKLKYSNTSNSIHVRCNVCDYYTNSIHKLQLHTTNPRHEISAKLFLHLQVNEDTVDTETTFYHCALCNVSTNTKVRLVQHVHSIEHLRTENLRQMQKKLEGQETEDDFREIYTVKNCRGSDRETNNCQSGPQPKEAAESKDHESGGPNTSAKGDGKNEESRLKQALTDYHKNGGTPDEHQDHVFTCPFCNYTNTSDVLIQMHVVAQHSQKPSLQCPLCQDSYHELSKLEKHLMESHKVSREGLERLLMIVDKSSGESPKCNSKMPEKREESLPDSKTNTTDDSENRESFNNCDVISDNLECSVCLKSFNSVDELFVHQNESGHLEIKQTPHGAGYICWKKGCNQFFRIPQAVQMHFKEVHIKKPQLAVSDRHVYKYRCSQCSLAFKTLEKLQLHSQYHVIRAASQCVLCGRSFRSVWALQKHVEASHTNMTKEEIQQYEASLVNNPLLTSSGNRVLDPQTTELLKKESNRESDEESEEMKVTLEPVEETDTIDVNEQAGVLGEPSSKEQMTFEDYMNNQAMAENSYNDPSRKYKCHRCKVAFTRQSYLTSHNKTLLHRKGEKMSYPMEKYLDPNRPYKCEVCKESFTQKNILLVHYNSVSHLHKLKQSMKDNSSVSTTTALSNSTTPVTVVSSSNRCSSPISNTTDSEKKPYKCNICKVAYNQNSTLDIHIRSVLHQTKASKLHELAMTGQVDLNLPLIEKPELIQAQESNQNNHEAGMSGITTTSAEFVPSLPQPCTLAGFGQIPSTSLPSTDTISSPSASSQLPFQVSHSTPSVTQTLNLASHFAQTSNFTPSQVSSQSPYICSRCNVPLSSQDALFQHQQICGFFSPPTASLFGGINGPVTSGLNSFGYSGLAQLPPVSPVTQSQDVNVSISNKKEFNVIKSDLSASQERHNPAETPKSNEQVTSQILMAKCPYPRPKPPMYKHLLESYGFEIVMQFNEFNQRKVKTDTEKEISENKENETTSKSILPNEIKQNNFEAKHKYLPEINKSTCNLCQKEFSSIWVLKAHKEEYHREIVPFSILEKFSQEYRIDYEKRNGINNQVQADELASNSDTASTPISTPDYSTQGQSVLNGINQTAMNIPSMSPVAPLATQQVVDSSNFAANQMAAQMQFNHLLMSMGFGMSMPVGMGMPIPMNIHPSLIPMMMPPPVESLMASAFNHQMMGGGFDPSIVNAQHKLLQEQQQQYLQAQQKRARTRISDDQLRILRAYFDINSSPSEEQLKEMSVKSGLPLKVIKHWFRNTLFKERQRNKDSPYNFNNPPSTYLNMEEYEKTGEAKPVVAQEVNQRFSNNDKTKHNYLSVEEVKHDTKKQGQDNELSELKLSTDIKPNSAESLPETPKSSESNEKTFDPTWSACETFLHNTPLKTVDSSMEASNLSDRCDSQHGNTSFKDLLQTSKDSVTNSSFSPAVTSSPTTPTSPDVLTIPRTDNHRQTSPHGLSPGRSVGSGKRANRTRFTDYQIKVLQEFFETNAYPKDDSLEYLSKLLSLSPRVIVVWFQNARQKARKVYENQPPVTSEEDAAGRFQRTPGLNYQCKKCLQVFQRYYELIKHQKGSCFKDENPLAAQINKTTTTVTEDPNRHSMSCSNQTPSCVPDQSKVSQNGSYRCDKCSLAFPRFDLWREHQLVHIMNPNLFPNYSTSSSIFQFETQQTMVPPVKRKLPEDDEAKDTNEQPRDKRLRTTILPEQLDYLYQKYQIESNPSRKMLENIAREVGLKKRVVQVWFQNTRARERKGQFRAHQQVIHKRCPFCRALFKARSALESHLATRHADQYTKGDINIDALPDGETDTDGGNSAEEESKESNSAFQGLPFPNPSFTPYGLPSSSTDVMHNSMNKYCEDELKNYLDELGTPSNFETMDIGVVSEKKEQLKKIDILESGDCPLDLSKPPKLNIESERLTDTIPTNHSDKSVEEASSKLVVIAEDARSETYSESTDREGEDITFDFNQTSPIAQNQMTPRHVTGSKKRFRTQMTTLQLKVMKSVFLDYKTPSMAECEILGHEIGLPKRVVQVWFQNARAKEKKYKLAFANTYGQELEAFKPSEECKVCNVKYNLKYSNTSIQDHIFSKQHIEKLKTEVESGKKHTDLLDSTHSSSDIPTSGNGSSETNLTQSQQQRETLTPSNVKPAVGVNSPSRPLLQTAAQTNFVQHLQMMGVQQVSALGIPNVGQSALTSLTGEHLQSSARTGEIITKEEGPGLCSSSSTGNVNTIAHTTKNPCPPGVDATTTVNPMPSTANTMSTSQTADVTSPSSEGAAGLLPFMYSNVPTSFYSGTPRSVISPNMYNTGCSAAKNLFYDSNMYSTPLSLLQLPPAVVLDVTQKLCQPGNSTIRFTQDGNNIDTIKGSIKETDVQQLAEVDIDTGFVCKKCQMVYPAEIICINHQRASCFADSKGETRATLKLVQTHFECRVCKERFSTVVDFKFHCDMDRHMKRVQKLQRELVSTCHSNDEGLILQSQLPGSQVIPSSTMSQRNFGAAAMLSSSSTSAMYPTLATPVNTSHLSSCSMMSSASQQSGIYPSIAPPMTSQPHAGNLISGGSSMHETRNGMPEIPSSLFFSGVQTDFRHDLDSSLNFTLGLDSVMMGNGMDISVSDHLSKIGMCYSGESNMNTEAKRL